MGTRYTVFKDGERSIEIDEGSNRFNVVLTGFDMTGEASIEDLLPDQLIQTALEMLKVASYWTDKGHVGRKMREFANEELL